MTKYIPFHDSDTNTCGKSDISNLLPDCADEYPERTPIAESMRIHFCDENGKGSITLEDLVDLMLVPPVAVVVSSAGSDPVDSGEMVTLDGTGSTSNNTIMSYQWEVLSVTGEGHVELTTPVSPTTGFILTGNDTEEVTAFVRLCVLDENGLGDCEVTTIVVSAANIGPVAVVSAPAEVHSGDTVTLDGSGSFDPDNGPDPLTYQWTQTCGTSTAITDSTSAIASFVVPNAPPSETLCFELAVSDGVSTTTSTVEIVTDNNPPEGGFTVDKSAPTVSDTVTITSTATDADGDTLTCAYTIAEA